jgi:hypothetical protein
MKLAYVPTPLDASMYPVTPPARIYQFVLSSLYQTDQMGHTIVL